MKQKKNWETEKQKKNIFFFKFQFQQNFTNFEQIYQFLAKNIFDFREKHLHKCLVEYVKNEFF